MKKLFLALILLSGCSLPNVYEKEVIVDSCRHKTVNLKLREHVWHNDELPEMMDRMEKQVYDEGLYVNKTKISICYDETTIIMLASDKPTRINDKAELAKHNRHMIREEKCDCRLCKKDK